MAGFFEKLFGSSNDDYDYDGYDELDNDYYDEMEDNYEFPDKKDYEYEEPVTSVKPERRHSGNSRVVELNQKSYKQQIVIMEPSNIETAQQVCDDVRAGKTVICNIEKIDPKIAQRVIDFITGAAHALRGNVMPISALIFVVAPGTTNIQNSVMSQHLSNTDSTEDYVRRAAVQVR